jgi:hypothetical protein
VFVYPDSLCATLLVVSAVLGVLELPLAGSLGLVAAGMLLFLGIIDAAYFAQHRMFARERGGVVNAGVVVAVLVVAVYLFIVYA